MIRGWQVVYLFSCLMLYVGPLNRGCQMIYFRTKNSNLDRFWRVLQWKIVYVMAIWYMYFTTIWYILWPIGIFYGPLVYFMAIWYTYMLVIWYIFPVWVSWNKKNRATLLWMETVNIFLAIRNIFPYWHVGNPAINMLVFRFKKMAKSRNETAQRVLCLALRYVHKKRSKLCSLCNLA
jgi:hypothetical protein